MEHVALCTEVLFGLCWRDISDGAKQAAVVEPVDPSERGHFQILHVAPWTLAMDQAALLDGPSIMQGLFQRIENKVCLGGPRDPPSHDSISECIDDEGQSRHFRGKLLHCRSHSILL